MRILRLIFLLLLFHPLFVSVLALAFEEENCEVIKDKTCINFGERMVDGFPVTRCWQYETMHKCASREQNNCDVFENNRGCNELTAKCLKSTVSGLCQNFQKKFVCGDKFEERDETKLITTEYKIKRDELDLSGCSESEINKNCVIKEENCIEGEETRNINGKDVYKKCWKWDRKYYCKQDTYIDECKSFKEKCEEVSRKCIHGAGMLWKNCEHYEVQYKCEEKQVEKIDCLANKFCIGGICDTYERHRHSDFAGSITPFIGLMAMKNEEMEGCSCPLGKKDCSPSEIEPKNCKVFKGGPERCKRVTGEYNCCSMKGFIKPIVECSKSELDLQKKRDAGLCHYVGSWKGKGAERIVKKQGYCCFKSKLSRIIQEGGRSQLGIGWGTPQNPDCRALSIEEIQKLDFEKIDFSSLFADVKANAENNFANHAGGFEKNIEQFASKQNAAGELLARKMKGFYQAKENHVTKSDDKEDENAGKE